MEIQPEIGVKTHDLLKGENGNSGDAKRPKVDGVEEFETSSSLDNIRNFDNFEFKSILNQSPEYKRVVLEGAYQGQSAVIILDKKPFSEGSLKELLSKDSELNLILRNDIYGSFDCDPIKKEAVIKTTVVYPATEKHIEKYRFSPFLIVEETPELYEKVVLPFLQSSSLAVDWVYNVLEHKKEADRIVFEDLDPESGFMLLPDLKWDGVQLENLYLSAIVISRGIKSLRDLKQSHLPLLENVLTNGSRAILKKYGVKRSQLRIYIHYQPSYYHLHVHFTSIQHNAAGINAEKAHLLQTVISNIKLTGDYYQKATLSYTVKEQGPLYKKVGPKRQACHLIGKHTISYVIFLCSFANMATSSNSATSVVGEVISNEGTTVTTPSAGERNLKEKCTTQSIEIVAEHFTKLSVINLYIKSELLTEAASKQIFLNDNGSSLKIKPLALTVTLKTLRFEYLPNSTSMEPSSIVNNLTQYRLITRPIDSTYGSARNQILPCYQYKIGEDRSKPNSQSNLVRRLQESVAYSVHCRSCSHVIATDIKFDRVRELPSSNWLEKSDEWFCHPPEAKCNPQDADTEADKLAQALESITLKQESAQKQTVFDILQNPEKATCLTGPSSWILNSKHVIDGLKSISTKSGYSHAKAIDQNLISCREKPCHCEKCGFEVGLYLTPSGVQLWNYGIRWKSVEQIDYPEARLRNLALADFKRTVLSGLNEFSFHLSCKLLVKSALTGDVIYLWKIGTDFSIYYATNVNPDCKHLTLESQNAVKFFYYTIIDGVSSLEDETQKTNCSDHDLEILVPKTVFNAGLAQLQKTSSVYSTQAGSMSCAFLLVNNEENDS